MFSSDRGNESDQGLRSKVVSPSGKSKTGGKVVARFLATCIPF